MISSKLWAGKAAALLSHWGRQFFLLTILLRQGTDSQNEYCTSVRYSTGVAAPIRWENSNEISIRFFNSWLYGGRTDHDGRDFVLIEQTLRIDPKAIKQPAHFAVPERRWTITKAAFCHGLRPFYRGKIPFNNKVTKHPVPVQICT